MSERHPLLTEQELADLTEIDRLLHEANQHSLGGDGYCKSSEGHISVDLGNHWERLPDEPRRPAKVSIYAYMIGPHRDHHFDSTAQALEVVQQWHRREMAYDYGQERLVGFDEPDLYLQIEGKRRADFEESMRLLEEAFGGDEEYAEMGEE